MVTVVRNAPIVHSGVAGMKWGYNDGKRNGKRTAAELNSLKDTQKKMGFAVSSNIEQDYNQADHMLRFLGITLDAHSNDEAVVRSMAIYRQMADTKDKYKNQYDWLKAFSNRLSSIGYDMKAVDAMIDKNKSTFQSIKSGGGADADVSNKASTADFATAYKTNKVKREAVKKHDKKVTKDSSKSKKKEEEESKTEEAKVTSEEAKDEEKKKTKAKSVKHSENQNGNELYHSGVKDMRWGVRRYQNPDGSLTPLGREHYGYKARRTNSTVEKLTGSTAKEFKDSFKPKDYNERLDKTRNTVGETKGSINNTTKAVKSANKIVDKIEESKYRKKLSKMSNSELEAEIAKAMPEYEARVLRQELEKKYDRIVGNTKSTKQGRENAMKALDIVGGVAMTSVSVLELILLLKKL